MPQGEFLGLNLAGPKHAVCVPSARNSGCSRAIPNHCHAQPWHPKFSMSKSKPSILLHPWGPLGMPIPVVDGAVKAYFIIKSKQPGSLKSWSPCREPQE